MILCNDTLMIYRFCYKKAPLQILFHKYLKKKRCMRKIYYTHPTYFVKGISTSKLLFSIFYFSSMSKIKSIYKIVDIKKCNWQRVAQRYHRKHICSYIFHFLEKASHMHTYERNLYKIKRRWIDEDEGCR